MKLISANIVAFGKLKNMTVNFASGVNLFQQDNGFGKSTLCAFIRAMLYGLGYTYKTVDGVRVNDVVRYKPWDCTGTFGGSLQIEHNQKQYRIERFFGNTARSESLKVVDLSTGKQLDIPSPGEHFLGLTVDSYDRCTYLPQEQVELASNENFDSKLANLVQDSAEDYDKLQEKLRAYKKTFKFERGVGGQIYTLENDILKLQRQLQQAETDRQNRANMTEQLAQTETQLQQLSTEQTQLQKRIDQLKQNLFTSQPTQADVDLVKKIDDVELKLATVPPTVEGDYNAFQQLLEQKSLLIKKRSALAKTANAFAVSLVLLLTLAVTLAILQIYLWAGVAVAVGAVLAIVLAPKLNRSFNKQKVVQIDEQLTAIASKYVNPSSKSVEELKSDFWQYYNNYQTNLSVRKALGSRPELNANSRQIQVELDQATIELQRLAERQQTLVKAQHQLQFALSQPTASIVDIAEELLYKQQLLATAKRKFAVANITAEVLASAKESLSSAYIPELCAKTQSLLNSITNGNYNVVTDRNFAISLQQNGQTKPLSAFSRGIREITLLCFRVAISQLIFGKDIPLLIVDDAFVNFDEQNFGRATQLLKQLSKTTQVIYFTCHNRTGNL
ncbi:MAG: AAA family ATPase [Clostridia bacterium]|nr:AAA family ATPase [Clostridia bacterium]